jgi:hypothetical protein
MKKLTFVFAAALALTFTFNAHAANSVTGKIKAITMHADNWGNYENGLTGRGYAFIVMDGLKESAVICPQGRVAIDSRHPMFNHVIALALSAKASGKTVMLKHTDTCTVRSNALDFAIITVNES